MMKFRVTALVLFLVAALSATTTTTAWQSSLPSDTRGIQLMGTMRRSFLLLGQIHTDSDTETDTSQQGMNQDDSSDNNNSNNNSNPQQINDRTTIPGGNNSQALKLSAKSSASTERMHDAIWHENLAEIQRLVNVEGVNVNGVHHGWSHLCRAACYKHVGVVAFLIENGANLEAKRSSWGGSPLNCACASGQLQVAQHLIRAGADLNAQDWLGETPLHHACYRKHLEIATLLIQHGADVLIKNNNGKTAFQLAVAQGCSSRIIDDLMAKVPSSLRTHLQRQAVLYQDEQQEQVPEYERPYSELVVNSKAGENAIMEAAPMEEVKRGDGLHLAASELDHNNNNGLHSSSTNHYSIHDRASYEELVHEASGLPDPTDFEELRQDPGFTQEFSWLRNQDEPSSAATGTSQPGMEYYDAGKDYEQYNNNGINDKPEGHHVAEECVLLDDMANLLMDSIQQMDQTLQNLNARMEFLEDRNQQVRYDMKAAYQETVHELDAMLTKSKRMLEEI